MEVRDASSQAGAGSELLQPVNFVQKLAASSSDDDVNQALVTMLVSNCPPTVSMHAGWLRKAATVLCRTWPKPYDMFCKREFVVAIWVTSGLLTATGDGMPDLIAACAMQ